MDIDVSILNTSGNKLVLLVSGVRSIEELATAFQDGVRDYSKGILADANKSIRGLESGKFILTCYPFYQGKREHVQSAICYELRRQLINPIKTTH